MTKGYIYKITNLINNKCYIGKTTNSIEKRFSEHLRDSSRESEEQRPLYDAINKYGATNFIIEEVECIDIDKLDEREMYWIKKYNSYKDGYNATLGGDGSTRLDYKKIIKVYEKTQNIRETARIMGCHHRSVEKILHNSNIKIKSSSDISKETNGNKINQYDLDGNYLGTHLSIADAVRAIGKPHNKTNRGASQKIALCCKGIRKTAYNYTWSYAN